MALRLRRGTDADRLIITPLEGELIYSTDSKKLYIGDGTTVGGNGLGDVESDTSPALGANLDLNTYNIVGTGNIDITGTITATGNINLGDAGSDQISIAGAITSNLIPNQDSAYNLGTPSVRWNNAFLTGLQVDGQIDAIAYNGDIIADDSSVVFDASANEIATGTVTGDLVHAGTTTSEGRLRSYSQSEGYVGAEILSWHDDTLAVVLQGVRSKGTAASPTAITNEDQLFSVQFSGWDGTQNTSAANITGVVGASGTVSAGQVPGKLVFQVRNAAGAFVTPIAIDETSTTNFVGETVHQNADATYKAASAITASKIMDLQRTRGTLESPTTINSNDHLYTLRWQGYDGGAYTTAAQIRVEAEGTISSGVVPGRLRMLVADDTGNIATAILVSGNNRTTTMNGTVSLTGALAVAGDATFESLSISQNNISSLDSNSNIVLDPAGTGTVQLEIPTQLTVGSAGAAAAIPASPSTYLKINVGGTDFVIPAFAVS